MLFATESTRTSLVRALIISLAACMAAGCNSRQEEATATPAEIRGEPIAPVAQSTNKTGGDAPLKIQAVDVAPPALKIVGRPQLSIQPPTDYPKGFVPVGFSRLGSFDFVMPEGGRIAGPDANGQRPTQIPSGIRALDRTPVALRGFMLPLKVNAQKGIVTELLLMKDQSMCCFGTTPRINEWVNVRLPEEKGVRAVLDEPVTIYGRLKVGEVGENGYLVGIYEMDGEGMMAMP